MSAAATARVGDEGPGRIGRYRLRERIGGGVASSVYAADSDRSLRPVAVKTIAADVQDEPETRGRFFREATVTAELQHRNIVTVLEVGEDDGRPFIAMELLKGQPLGEYLRSEDARPLEVRIGLLMQLCEGLQAAHDRGIVHRDIKPSNLFVQRNGCLKILDFGLARLQASTLTANGQIVGTPDFMSPEQSQGHRVDARSDIFSAAAVGYLMFTGRAPFTSTDLRKTLHALLEEAPAPIDAGEAPPAVARVLVKALSKRPDDRYQSCAEMRVDLERARHAADGPAGRTRIAADVGMVRL